MTLNTSEILTTVDARSLVCPLPLLKAKQGLNLLSEGGVIQVLATDPGSKRDIIAYINISPHELVSFREDDGVFVYIIKKGRITSS